MSSDRPDVAPSGEPAVRGDSPNQFPSQASDEGQFPGAPVTAGAGSLEIPPGTAAPGASTPGPGGPKGKKGELSTRTSAAWTALAVGMALLIVVVVFILENLQNVKVTFFGVHWKIPLALDLLLAAALGGAVVFAAGALRMLQLRLHARRRRPS